MYIKGSFCHGGIPQYFPNISRRDREIWILPFPLEEMFWMCMFHILYPWHVHNTLSCSYIIIQSIPCEREVQLKVNRGSHRHSSSCEPSLSSQPSSTPPATREIVDLWVNTSSPVQPTSSAFVAAYREMAELRIVAIARPATRAAHTYMCKLRGTYRTAKAQQANRLHPGQLFFHGKKSCPKLDSNLQSRSIRQWHHYCTDR